MNFVFDFDSTIINIESLDFLISKVSNGKYDKEIEEITNLGMSGSINLLESITRRMQICSITKQQLQDNANLMTNYITREIDDVIKLIQTKGHNVYIVSGGMIDLILPVALKLNIFHKNCIANEIFFNSDGSFKEINKSSPLLYKNGKSDAIRQLGILNNKTIMIGDGYTDLEVNLNNPFIDFIGFGVNIQRDSVKKQAKIFTKTMQEFKNVINQKI